MRAIEFQSSLAAELQRFVELRRAGGFDYQAQARLLLYFDRFLEHLETARRCSARTRNARLAAVRAFFGFLARENPLLLPQCQAIRAIPLKRHEHETMTYLEEAETQAVLDATGGTARTSVRDQALLLMLYNTGARVSEIVNLKVGDLRLADVPQVNLLGKRSKTP